MLKAGVAVLLNVRAGWQVVAGGGGAEAAADPLSQCYLATWGYGEAEAAGQVVTDVEVGRAGGLPS